MFGNHYTHLKSSASHVGLQKKWNAVAAKRVGTHRKRTSDWKK